MKNNTKCQKLLETQVIILGVIENFTKLKLGSCRKHSILRQLLITKSNI